MKIYYITFRSVTFAQRGERLFREQGIGCTMQRTPRSMEERGCGYSLRLRTIQLHRAQALLRDAGIPFRRIYREGAGGEWEEVQV